MELMHRMQPKDKSHIKDPCKTRTTEEEEAATNKITISSKDNQDSTKEMVVLPIITSKPSSASFTSKVRILERLHLII